MMCRAWGVHCSPASRNPGYLMASQQAFIRRNWRTVIAAGSLGFDAAIITAAFLFAVRVEMSGLAFSEAVQESSGTLGLILGVFLSFFTSLGVYRTTAQSSFYRQAYLAGKGFVFSIALILTVLFLVYGSGVSRLLLLAFFGSYPFLYLSAWYGARVILRSLRRLGFGRWNTLAIGSNPYLGSLLRRLERFPDLGYDVVSVITTPFSENGDKSLHVERSTVERVVEDKNIELITISTAQLNGSYEVLESLCVRERIGMRVISPEADFLFSKAGLHDIAGISIYTPSRHRVDLAKRVIKRLFDIVISSICILLLSPIFISVAIATKLESRGPVFFRQKRSLADNDEPFDFFKFRSMYHGADAEKEKLFHHNEASGALFKMRDDPRITKVGKVIRRYSIDELPQLFNVLLGDMSLVGPRPLPVSDYRRMKEEDSLGGYFRQRTLSKPGMTGLWQISGRSDIGFREMVLLDLYYIENQSILYDLEILAQTVPVVLFGKGAY
jgi:exopolysaccharide biosynthesis polyprenyl glycosylphosphotransferase